jgi:L-ascorbate metabolism protein UlaG (beta-lactamase superfamily)
MEIRFLGHSTFEIVDGATRVLVDPFLTGNPKAAVGADELEPTLICLSHGHADHMADAVGIAKRTGAPILALTEIAGELRGEGVETFDPNFGGTVGFEWGWVKLVPAWHSSTTPGGTVSPPAGLLIRVGDKLVYYLGDTALFSDMQLIARRGNHVDVALVPIGGHYTMDRFDAVAAAEFIGADIVIPCHYDTFPAIETDAQAFKSDVENATETKVVVLAPGRDAHGPVNHAIVLIEAEQAALADLGGRLADVEGVAEAYSVTGEWDFVALVRVRSTEEIAEVVTRRISQVAGIRRTHTMVAFEVFSQHDLESLFSIGA